MLIGCALAVRIEPVAELLAGFEKRHPLFLDIDALARTRVAAAARRSILYGEGAKTAELDPVALSQCVGDLVKDGTNDVFHVALKEMWIAVGNNLNEL